MKDLFKFFFNKPDNEEVYESNTKLDASFVILIDDLSIGFLERINNLWQFRYSDEFKAQDEYHRLVGFSDINKLYESEILWPFFKVRIPGLKQPMIQEILEEDKLDKSDEASLLRRFGRVSLANPYILNPL